MSNSLEPDQARHYVGPELDPNCLQRISADDTLIFPSRSKGEKRHTFLPSWAQTFSVVSVSSSASPGMAVFCHMTLHTGTQNLSV